MVRINSLLPLITKGRVFMKLKKLAIHSMVGALAFSSALTVFAATPDTALQAGSTIESSIIKGENGFLICIKPILPSCPNKPELPDRPTLPEPPEKPEVPTPPDTPAVPGLPDGSELPDISVDPEVPEKPEVPNKPEPPNKPELPQDQAAAFENEVLNLVNIERGRNQLTPLKMDENVRKVAREKSRDMSVNNYFSHTSPTYGSPFDMLKQFGISYKRAAENIAQGYTSPQAVVTGWMNSDGHRKNILNPDLTHIGVGYYSLGNYWTQLFITP